ncbi:MAG: hypothetical protein JXB85_01940 [Anaerolineales bacterium]|nr:hypothetical protein [Anaerolineales bacterium]
MTASTELVAGLISFLLTLMVLSYLLGDNPLFRIAIYLFVGVAAGYATAVAWQHVILPRLIHPLLNGNWEERALAAFALLLGALLLGKMTPRTSRMGSLSIALMVGVGAAVAIGGALLGTLFPQFAAATDAFTIDYDQPYGLEYLIAAIFMLIGTVTTLIYFHFGARARAGDTRRSRFVAALGWIGQIFVAITFGVIFAGVYAAALSALIERLASIRSLF